VIGTTISHYNILEKLGEGGMGIVYKAQDTKLNRFVALKFLPERVNRSEGDKARFMQEAQAAASLNHANICTIFGVEEIEAKMFIAMEYVDGGTLREKIVGAMHESPKALGGQLSAPTVDDAINIAVQIGEAMQEAHSKGIVHRDIKADNIMLTSKGQAKVMDFGLAKLKGAMKLTRTSSTVGTLGYMAPEQIQGGEADHRSDIFSFGVLLYEMLTGRLPFRGEHEAAMVYSIVNEEPQSLQKFLPDASPQLAAMIERALEKNPEDRFQSMQDVTVELRRMQRKSTKVPRSAFTEAASIPQTSSQEKFATQSSLRSNKKLLYGSIGVVGVAAVVAVYLFFGRQQTIDSLAVLPFENVGASTEQEYLSDGVTESVINNLTKISSLRVIPRSTVFRFKGKEMDIQEIGVKLNVAAVLSGRITHRGQALDVQVDLIDIKRESQLWGNRYQSSAADILTLQQQITNDVSARLGIGLSTETREKLAKRATDNTQAYQLYLQGRYYWNKRTSVGIDRAIDYFNKAISLDSMYALAYAGLADSYLIQPQYSGTPTRISVPLAVEAAHRAVELDATSAEAQTSLAFAYFDEWKFEEAEREFKHAISLNPRYPTAYHWYSILLARVGRSDETSTVINRAYELDPYSPIIALNVALISFRQGKYDESLRLLRQSTELDPSFASGYAWEGMTLMRMKNYTKAEASFLKAVELSGRSSESLSFLGYFYGKRRKRSEAMTIARDLEQRYRAGNGAAYNIAYVFAGLAEKDKILTWLEQDVQDRSTFATQLKEDQVWSDVQTDPRFIALLKKVGLEK